MRPPAFWNWAPQRFSLHSIMLAPLGWLYRAITARRVAQPAALKADIPVLCIGNLNAGGTGKTPTAIALIQHLRSKGLTPHVISRGYGGSATELTRVDERNHSAALVGDEPMLLAAFAPTWVSADRTEAAKAAQEAGADIILMDDGFQNPSLFKDASIIVADAQRGFGNGRCIPSGPLREPVAKGLARGDLLLTIGDTAAQALFDSLWAPQVSLPHARAHLAPLQTGMDWTATPFMAFAGIGYPEKFFATLRAQGATILQTHALDDHQPLTTALLQRMEADAARLGAQLVTTEKDAVRLPAAYRRKVLTLPVRLEVEDWADIDALLDRILK
ncbi:MAG: tetraacyldisaccharide 4'-kinase [Cognatishimia sp.]|nr:tetraacyldisaccharide 4'-kinase [Cognatishimia sp.]